MKPFSGLAAALMTSAMCMTLTACNQPPAAPPTAENLLFPTLGAAPYAADYTMNYGDAARTMRIIRSGASQRIENAVPGAASGEGKTMVMLIDAATGKMMQFQTGPTAPKTAIVIDRNKLGAFADALDVETAAKTSPPKHLGKDTVAGVDCEIWEMPPPAPKSDATPSAQAPAAAADPNPRQICVTRDGIMLRVQEAKAAQPELIATKVQRGAQDPALFAVPADYKVVDMSQCTAAMGDMLAAAKAGKKPDTSAMAKCKGMAGAFNDPQR